MNVIHQFINNRKGKRVGCVASTDAGKVGWSLCKLKAGDVFDKDIALTIAIGRATTKPVTDISSVPHLLQNTVTFFKDVRSVAYFKKA